MENTEKDQKKTNYTLLRVLVIAGILILLIFLSIGIVRFVPKALNSLASASLSIGSIFNNGTSTDATPNDSTYVYDANNPGTSIATSSGGFSIRDITTGTSTISGNTSGQGGASNAGVRTNTQTTVRSNSTSYSNSNGSVSYANTSYTTVGASDIAVEVLSKGIIDKNTGAFIPSNSFTTSDVVVIKFKIENRGQYATGAWSARVNMPSGNTVDAIRTLGPIGSLPAQAAITGEARFDRPLSGNQNVTISVDTGNSTNDINRNNNIIAVPIYVTGTNNGGGTVVINGTQPDLQVRVLSTGTVNGAGQYVANTTPRYGEKAAVRFEVTNNGSTASPAWSWRADISGAATNTYYSPIEAGIVGGGSATFIVGLDVPYNSNGSNYYNNNNNGTYNSCYTGSYYSGYDDCLRNQNGWNNGYYNNNNNYQNQNQTRSMYFTIYVDTANTVYETNESNNSISATVNTTY